MKEIENVIYMVILQFILYLQMFVLSPQFLMKNFDDSIWISINVIFILIINILAFRYKKLKIRDLLVGVLIMWSFINSFGIFDLYGISDPVYGLDFTSKELDALFFSIVICIIQIVLTILMNINAIIEFYRLNKLKLNEVKYVLLYQLIIYFGVFIITPNIVIPFTNTGIWILTNIIIIVSITTYKSKENFFEIRNILKSGLFLWVLIWAYHPAKEYRVSMQTTGRDFFPPIIDSLIVSVIILVLEYITNLTINFIRENLKSNTK